MSRALSQRASQKPSRPASKATAMRLIRCPAFAASSRHRCSNFSNALSSTASFFNGWRSTPGTMPATSQLDRLSSITAISVPSGSRGFGDRLRSFNFCMGRSIGSYQQRWMQYPRRRPIASPLEVCVRRPPVCAAPPSWGRHPQTFTTADLHQRAGSGAAIRRCQYQYIREGQAGAMYEFMREFAALEPQPPELQQLFRTVHGNQAAMDGFGEYRSDFFAAAAKKAHSVAATAE